MPNINKCVYEREREREGESLLPGSTQSLQSKDFFFKCGRGRAKIFF